MKKRGLALLIFIALIYWGFFFIIRMRDEAGSRQPETGSYIGAAEESAREMTRYTLESAIKVFEMLEGYFPATLEELVVAGYLTSLPEDHGSPWEFDPSDGSIR